MTRIKWTFHGPCWILLLLAALCVTAHAQVVRPRQADVVLSSDRAPPPSTADWRRVELPFSTDQSAAWFRIDFQLGEGPPDDSRAIYLPYLYGGGRLFLNGLALNRIKESDADRVVRWERPHLIPIPDALLRPGTNRLIVRVPMPVAQRVHMPLLAIGPYAQLVREYDKRMFWTRTMSQFTVISCLIGGVLALFIWWRRHEELPYGLFGAAALLWGVRTLTFVLEEIPVAAWPAWRIVYHGATGGFVIILLLFALSLAGIRFPRLKLWLFGYWLLGPVGYLAGGASELLLSRYWAGGLIPIGFAIVAISASAAWRQRTVAMTMLSLALGVAVLAGVHDYLIASNADVIRALVPRAAAQRFFLLHLAADVLLLVMGGILSARLVGTLKAIEQLNRTLEARVAERETALADNYDRLRRLERQHAAGEERQRIMRDLHDGLGSQLFITLSRAEAGRIAPGEIVQALRECIADMRLTLEAMSPESTDFLEIWSNFRFRWQQRLEAAGLTSTWEVEGNGGSVELAPHASLQLLRIVQEALTNVLKHADAAKVLIRLRTDDGAIAIQVFDDGRGLDNSRTRAGRGLENMRARALRVGAHLEIADLNPGVRVSVNLRRDALAA